MPFDPGLDAQLQLLAGAHAMTRQKMFGGTCFLLDGKMVCGVWKDFLILRLGEAGAAEALSQPGVKVFDITGKAMKGWVMVDRGHLAGNGVAAWFERARAYAESLPAAR